MKPIRRMIGNAGPYYLYIERDVAGNRFLIEHETRGVIFRPDTRQLGEAVLTNLAIHNPKGR